MFPDKEDPSNYDGLLMLKDVEHVSDILHENRNSMLLVAIYSKTCSQSYDFLLKLKEVDETLALMFGQKNESDHGLSGPALPTQYPPFIAKIDSKNVDSSWIKTLAVTFYPSLLFFRQVGEETIVMDYMGRQEEPKDIIDTIFHYWYRFNLGPVFQASSLQEVKSMIETNGPRMLQHVSPAWNPDYTLEERETISWLMTSDEDTLDPYIVLLQCQMLEQEQDSYTAFSDLATTTATQRNMALFSIVNDCSALGSDGDIVAFSVSPETWEVKRIATMQSHHASMYQFAVEMTSPSIMFYDRFSVAPIAFPMYRKVHAVLFVRLDKDDAISHKAIRSLRRACQKHKVESIAIKEDMVCLVVPETETRLLTYFDVDIWTPLDAKLSKRMPIQPLLPVLLITDQRKEGHFIRYYLNATHLVKDINSSIPTFLREFQNGVLSPEIKSSQKPVRTNKQGVEIITGLSFSETVIARRENHTLLYLYSPTCGHCKRFSVLWNELSQIVRAVEWDVDIMQMDITENEIRDARIAVDPAFLPAVYYFPAGSKEQAVPFDLEDRFGDTVGRLRDPFDVLDWMLSVGEFEENKMLQEIQKLDGVHQSVA